VQGPDVQRAKERPLLPWTIVAVVLVCGALVAVIALVLRLNTNDRDLALARFKEERMRQVDEAADESRGDFEDIAGHLRYAGQLVWASDSASDRERELLALLAVVRQYHVVRIYDAKGGLALSVVDPLKKPPFPIGVYAAAMAETAAHAAAREPGEIETSPALDADAGGWLRVFATPLPSRAGVIAVLVDTEPLFGRLRLLGSTSGGHLVLLGAYGKPVPATDAAIEPRLAPGALPPGRVADLVSELRAGARGQERLAPEEAAALGLPREPTVLSFAPVPLPGGGHWEIATLTSTAPLRTLERTLVWRMGLGAGASLVVLLVFGAYVVLTARRAAAARERLRHAEELAKLQAQLIHAEKLATLGVVATGIAHEIGTPLGVVRARAELVQGKVAEDHPARASLTVIIEQIDRVSRTIRGLLDFARVKPVAVQAVDLAAAGRTVADLLRFEAERRKVALHLDVGEPSPRAAADPDQLQQVLVNLVMNGLDACAPGGHVTVRAAAEDGRARVDVVDDGAGIPEALHKKVFDPFFTTKESGRGTGLGLPLSAQIVRAHGGEITLDSHEGRGTTVTVKWPLAPREEAHA
jgi:signal transduction histidine kinase